MAATFSARCSCRILFAQSCWPLLCASRHPSKSGCFGRGRNGMATVSAYRRCWTFRPRLAYGADSTNVPPRAEGRQLAALPPRRCMAIDTLGLEEVLSSMPNPRRLRTWPHNNPPLAARPSWSRRPGAQYRTKTGFSGSNAAATESPAALVNLSVGIV